jgi:hypothetical protein
MLRRLTTISLVALALASSACSPYLFRQVATAAIVTAAVVGTARAMAYHDAHYHYHTCGHERRWHDGRWVYHYEGHWEYYDPHTDGWYYYDD